MSFVHLRIHTEFSLSDSVVRIGPLMDRVVEDTMPAVGLTDQSNLFALVKFYSQAEKRGIKPIIGADLWVRPDSPREQPHRLTLFCRNHEGYLRLSELITRSYREGQHNGPPMIEREWLHGHTDGLLALSGGRFGDVGKLLLNGHEQLAEQAAQQWAALFPNAWYLELTRTGRDNEEAYINAAVGLASKLSLPVVATNDVRFLSADDFEAHEARVCIHDGHQLDDPRRHHYYSDDQYLRSTQEMQTLFADIPSALENTVEIARRCTLELNLGKNYLPEFPVPGGEDVRSWLRKQSSEGLQHRLDALPLNEGESHEARDKPYWERLERELGVIIDMDFPGYFLIVADFIRWSKANGVPVGPGRGSGAGSVVAWALGITDLDPLEYDLLFERFLNPERVSMPDFDVDFCMENRDRVIEYVADQYGRDHVSQIITYGTMAAKAVVRDVGRVLGHSYGEVDRIAKMIPPDLGITLDEALEQGEDLKNAYHDDEVVRTLIDLARKLEGITRNAGKHAGGVVIAPAPLTDFTPLYVEQGGDNAVTQLDKDDVEAVGLVKFDFLGLRTLTIIDRAVKTINAARKHNGEATLDISTLAMDDPAVFDLVRACNTTAVFQFESRGMKDLIRRLQPDVFEDLVAVNALFRPGPLQSGMVDDFINRKHGRAEVAYPHPSLEPVLKPTYGVILYQEQVMQSAQVLAGYSLGGADLLRRAMGKKKAAEMAKQRDIFIEGAQQNNIDGALANEIFDLIEKFAGYGFNKSHSAAYALLSYQTAWLKAYYPAAFMAAVMSADMDNTDKVVVLIEDARENGLEVLKPDINASDYAFTTEGERKIRYGLGAIKGVGHAAIQTIMHERVNGPYKNLDDLCHRIDTHKANKRVLEALNRAGALDNLAPHRAAIAAMVEDSLKRADQARAAQEAGQNDMFGLAADPEPATADAPTAPRTHVKPWDDKTRLVGEKETLGLYLTGHPINRYKKELSQIVTGTIAHLIDSMPAPASGGGYGHPRQAVVVAGLVTDIRKRGSRVSFMLDDSSGRVEVTVFEDVWRRYENIVVKDELLICHGKMSFDDFINGYRVRANDMVDINAVRAQRLRAIRIHWHASEHSRHVFIDHLKRALNEAGSGPCRVEVRYYGVGARADFKLGERWRIIPTDNLMTQLDELVGAENINIKYTKPEHADAEPATTNS